MMDSVLTNARILIVDDKISNIDILVDLIEESGYTNFKHTTDPREVVNLYKSFEPDIILLDLMMPYLNGFEVMEQLSNIILANTYLPILVLTADITPETKCKALSSGARDFLSKPFDLTEVKLRIKNLLQTRFLHLQIENQNQILEEKVKERTIDLEQANQALDMANRELSVLDQAKNDFLSLISHEIRTPLNGIKGFISLLKEEIDSPDLREYLLYLDTSAIRLERFSYQALLITELHAGKRKVRNQEVLLSELLDKTQEFLKEKILGKSIAVHIQQNPSVASIKGDEELIKICFERLLDNSVKYSPSNSQVTVIIAAGDHSTVCEFIDQGQGFPQKVLANPFMVFGLGERHIDRSTGLNLALVRLIMEAHHGLVEIGNNPKGGAFVKLTFASQH